jgi:hypothetical protein
MNWDHVIVTMCVVVCNYVYLLVVSVTPGGMWLMVCQCLQEGLTTYAFGMIVTCICLDVCGYVKPTVWSSNHSYNL